MTVGALVDSNVLLDIFTEDATWLEWSSNALADAAEAGPLYINPIVYAEISVRFSRIEDLDDALDPDHFRRVPLPWTAGFLAGKAFLTYRRDRGTALTPLPDFYIGAHAAVEDLELLTRDPARYRTYFPKLQLRAPERCGFDSERRLGRLVTGASIQCSHERYNHRQGLASGADQPARRAAPSVGDR